MPRKIYKRSNYRKYSRRTLSTRNIYSNRSARSQAYQIAALKRRINYVSRQCKPEIKVLTSDLVSDDFDSATAYGKIKIMPPAQGTGESERVGNSWNVKSGTFRLFLNRSYVLSTGVVDNGLSFRVIVVQTQAPTSSNNAVPNVSELLVNSTNNSECLMSPFKDGITARYRILKDYKFSGVQNEKLVNLRYYPFKHEETDPSGNQRMIYIYMIPSVTGTSNTTSMKATNRYVFTDA